MTSTAASLRAPALAFSHRWRAVNDWLVQHQPLWRPVPFSEPAPAWLRDCPELAGWLEAITDEECDCWTNNPEAFACEAARFIPDLAAYGELVAVPELATSERAQAAALPEVRAVDMPGRKRLQAGAFAASLSPLEGKLVDWCCGKGHLARTLVEQGVESVLGLEWNAELVNDGNRLAQHYGDPVQLRQQDVMASNVAWPAAGQGVALHACGDLHRQLIKTGSAAKATRLAISPCCYHLMASTHYQLLSVAACNHARPLTMDRRTLRLAVQETVTAPARERRQAAVVSVWRLGFDALQRHLRGADRYLPVPSHPARLNTGDFRTFCTWAADKKRLELPAQVDWLYWLAKGERRLQQVRRHELLRHLFRRPLELWLVLDYAVFLEEQGYRVRLGTFCERSLTPRNLLLDAVRGRA
ncbi:methyltransferase [Marinobacter sp.]|uniref:methyltransferase n=1 Tax=Marinobacter sp. TaxID=50741 RepID=UPI0019FADC3F|nr:methyltransferase [Marinobacter sp.]MBE0486723.1 methyltransferase [Marinobacter sp.]